MDLKNAVNTPKGRLVSRRALPYWLSYFQFNAFLVLIRVFPRKSAANYDD
jgi:hypothetical protein